jgi:hypothetical protein
MTKWKRTKQRIDNLPDAIVFQAVQDYTKALRHQDGRTIRECERFFNSEWFYTLTSVSGEFFMEQLQKRVKHKEVLL